MADLIANAATRNFPILVGESLTVGRLGEADIPLHGERGPAANEIHGVCYVLSALSTSWTVEVPVNKKPSLFVHNRTSPSEHHPPVRPGDGPRHFYLENAEVTFTMSGLLWRLGVVSKPNAPLVVPPTGTTQRPIIVLDPHSPRHRVVIVACLDALASPGAQALSHRAVAEYLKAHGPKADHTLTETAAENRWNRAMYDLDAEYIATLTGSDPKDRTAIVRYLVDSGSVARSDVGSIDKVPANT